MVYKIPLNYPNDDFISQKNHHNHKYTMDAVAVYCVLSYQPLLVIALGDKIAASASSLRRFSCRTSSATPKPLSKA